MKEKISRAELSSTALAAIRAEPGCSDVEEISITLVNVLDSAPTWHITVMNSGSAPFEVANHAAWRVQERLSVQFDLIS